MQITRKIALIAAFLGTGTVLAAAVQAQVTLDYAWTFHAKTSGERVAFSWTRYPDAKAFARYEIVRTPPDGPKAPDAGDKVAVTTNRYSTNAEDAPPESNDYWYRLCADLTTGDKTCSRPLKVAVTVPDAPAAPSSVPTPAPSAAPVVIQAPTSTDPVIPVLPADPGTLQLSATAAGNAISLSWTPTNDTGSFVEYVLVRSVTTSTPSYPVDGYLAKIRDLSRTTFVDDVYIDPAFYRAPRHYRVCEVDTASNVRCGSVATISL